MREAEGLRSNIVNRVDPRANLTYGGGSAGEARFVFGALDQQSQCASMIGFKPLMVH